MKPLTDGERQKTGGSASCNRLTFDCSGCHCAINTNTATHTRAAELRSLAVDPLVVLQPTDHD